MAASARTRAGTALVLAGIVFGMAGLSFAAVPLYDLFCQVTGYGGTTQVDREGGPRAALDRRMTIRFSATVAGGLPWSFAPVERTVDIGVGADALAFYRAESLAGAPTTGTATFNVTPAKAGQYFVKLDCFCFNEQTLAAGEAADMAVSFYVDPKIAEDPNLDDVTTITLSYTFFPAPAALQQSRIDG
jgi:cytochrome c oxidase assembly protein subunit 11